MSTSNLNWRRWLKNGDQYLRAVRPGVEKSRFGTNIRYNMLSMSLESYVMAMLDFHGRLPENHTYTDLMTALDGVVSIEDALKRRILSYENIQSICSVEKYHRKDPTEPELLDLRDAIAELRKIAHETCESDMPAVMFS